MTETKNLLNSGTTSPPTEPGEGVALLSAKMFDFLGDQADLTNEKVVRFMANTIAQRLIDWIQWEELVNEENVHAVHTGVHAVIKEALEQLGRADVRIG